MRRARARGLQRIVEHGRIGMMPLRRLPALLLLGGIVYTLVPGYRGIGAIASSLGAVVLGPNRLRVGRGRPGSAIGWVLVLCGAFVVAEALIWMSIGGS